MSSKFRSQSSRAPTRRGLESAPLALLTLRRSVSSGRSESGHVMAEPPSMTNASLQPARVFLPAAGGTGSPVAGSRDAWGAPGFARSCPLPGARLIEGAPDGV